MIVGNVTAGAGIKPAEQGRAMSGDVLVCIGISVPAAADAAAGAGGTTHSSTSLSLHLRLLVNVDVGLALWPVTWSFRLASEAYVLVQPVSVHANTVGYKEGDFASRLCSLIMCLLACKAVL